MVAEGNATAPASGPPGLAEPPTSLSSAGAQDHGGRHILLSASVPALAVAASSVLIDASLPPRRSAERLTAQATALVGAVVQHAMVRSSLLPPLALRVGEAEDRSETTAAAAFDLVAACVYCTVLLSVVSASAAAAAERRGKTARRWRDLARLLPASSLPPLSYAVSLLLDTDRLSGRDVVSIALPTLAALFLCSLAALLFIRRASKRRSGTMLLCAILGVPEGNANNAPGALGSSGGDGRPYDERTWYDWSPGQVMRWVSDLPEESLQSLAEIMESERIDGMAFEAVTMEDLRSFGIPYGDANRLKRHISKLIANYGGSRARMEEERYLRYGPSPVHQEQEEVLDADKWLSAEHSTASWRMQPAQNFASCDLDGETAERAKDIFSSKFGLKLPEIRTLTGAKKSAGDVAIEMPDMSGSVKHPNAQIDDAALLSLPPEIREIAERRPDLVRAFAQKHAQNIEANQSHPMAEGDATGEEVKMIQSLQGGGGGGAASIDPGLLKAMPPHIREIADRRPDLVSSILTSRNAVPAAAEHRDFSRGGGGMPSSMHLSRVQEHRMASDPSYARRFVGAQAAAELSGCPVASSLLPVREEDEGSEVNDVEDVEDGGDLVSLLRRRPNR